MSQTKAVATINAMVKMNDKKFISVFEKMMPIKDGRVHGRTLWRWLDSKQEFSKWIKGRIEKYDFVENQDFTVIDKIVKNLKGGRPTTEYSLTIEMAKELAMVENNLNGKMARRYFILVEKSATEVIPQTIEEIQDLLIIAKQKRIDEQQLEIKMEKKSKAGLKGHDTRKRKQLDTAKTFLGIDTDKELNYITYQSLVELGNSPTKAKIKEYVKENRPQYDGDSWETLAFPAFIWKRINDFNNM